MELIVLLEINSNSSPVAAPLKWTLVTVAAIAAAVAAIAAVALFVPPFAVFLGLTAGTLYIVLGSSGLLAVLSASTVIFLSCQKSKNPDSTNILDLKPDLMRHISSFLPISGVSGLERVNKQTKSALSKSYIELAKEFGYIGNNLKEAKLHLKILFDLIKSKRFERLHLSFNNNIRFAIVYKQKSFFSFREVDVINTLRSFKSLSTLDILAIALNSPNRRVRLFCTQILEGKTISESEGAERYWMDALQKCSWEEAQFYLQFVRKRDPSAFACVNKEGAQFLLDNGWSVNSVDSKGATPLHYARSTELAEWLIAKGANPHLVDFAGSTPLHYFIRTRYNRWREDGNEVFNHIEYLLKFGMEPDDVNKFQETPLSLLAGSSNQQVIDLLKKRLRIKIASEVFNEYPALNTKEREKILEERWRAKGV